MKVERLAIPEVILITPEARSDTRGAFLECWQSTRYGAAGLPTRWVQDNVSRSRRSVLRGLHFQYPRGQGKLVSVMAGEILDVAVDVRRGSPTFGRSVAVTLSATVAHQLFIPPGFAHGFIVTSEEATVHYKCTDFYVPECERTIAWNDPALGIAWPEQSPVLSPRDAAAACLAKLSEQELPEFLPDR